MTAYSKQLIVFDLDGTLAPSKQPIAPDMAELVVRLLARKKVAVISGGGYPQFEIQFLGALPGTSSYFSNLFLLPASGTRLYDWHGAWKAQYAEHLSPHEKTKVIAALNAAMIGSGYIKPDKTYGDIIEDRGSQITFSALGQNVPIDVKSAWDPTRTKREKMAEILQKKIPEFDVRLGGTTSIDITRRGVNKAYGIRKLEQFLKIPADDIVFVGDALFYGGNDYPAKATGVDCISVKGPEDTKKIIESWLG